MNAPEPIVVVAQWQPHARALNEVLDLTTEMRRLSLGEPGCLGYEVFQGVGLPRTILLLERYRDQAALEAHKASAHYQELVVKRVLPLLADRQVELLQPRQA